MLNEKQIKNNFEFIERELQSTNWSNKRDLLWHEGYLAALTNVLKSENNDYLDRYLKAALEVERRVRDEKLLPEVG